jgi:hypothetical protein
MGITPLGKKIKHDILIPLPKTCLERAGLFLLLAFVLNQNNMSRSHTSMFGEDVKYLLALSLLAWITFTLPSVQAALIG